MDSRATAYSPCGLAADVDYFSPHSKHYINNANTSSDEILIVKRGGGSKHLFIERQNVIQKEKNMDSRATAYSPCGLAAISRQH
jgi:hypothetical protein